MRKRFFVVLICLASFSIRWGLVFSAPAYGTNLPLRKQFVVGFETYHVFDRDLEENYGSLRSSQNFFLLTYGLREWLSIDLKIGLGNIKQHPENVDELDYRSSFAGGYGFRFKLLDDTAHGIKTVFGFHHISVHPHTLRVNSVKHTGIIDDWQFSLLFSKNVLNLTPYIGTKWSRLDYIHWEAGERKRRMSDLTEDIGLIAGIDTPFFMNTLLNLEGHFIDEKAVSLSLMYAF
ncbi:MAG: hypothetical protein ABH858_03600 [Candidatus Omnitrophota bacterium]